MTFDFTSSDAFILSESSSKGNQPKWYSGGYWYKADHMGYEGLCETVISNLLKKTNVDIFVEYEPVKIRFDGKEKSGCRCKSFLHKNESLITLEHLFRAYNGISLAKALTDYHEAEDRIKFTVDFVENVTGLESSGAYFSVMLALDAFFLNEDRHTNNIAFIRNETNGKFSFCPFFDFGLSMLSDAEDYPFDENIIETINSVTAKPFDRDFDVQLDACEKLYGSKLKIGFSKADITNSLNGVSEYYSEEILNRTAEILFQRLRKFNYLTV